MQRQRFGIATPRLLSTGLIFIWVAIVAHLGWTLELPGPSASDEILRHVKYLASAELTGRGVDTPGIKLARDYIAGEFAKYGLRPGGDNGTFFQGFDVAVGVTVRQPSGLTLGANPLLKLSEDWTPLGFSTSGKIDAPLVFAGYGITAKDYGYDDYAGINVNGKIVVVLRYEPPPKNDKSPFKKSPNYSSHATLRTKANNARDHGAVGLILVDLNHNGADNPQLISTRGGLSRGGNSLIAVQVRRQLMERWLESHGITLNSLKERIDRDEKPASMLIADAAAKIEVSLQEERQRTENIVAVLPGADPSLRDEPIVIGAHYDHLGFGRFGIANAAAAGQIHHGADDNASGAATIIEIARRMSQLPTKPLRTVIFVAFSAEELGLHGSRHFVEHSEPGKRIKTMINLDMVGRLRNDRLTVFGARSGDTLSAVIQSAARDLGLVIVESDDVGRSDHLSFYNRKIPVLHLFTGAHADYHRPSDTWDKLNIDGMARISDLVLVTGLKIADTKEAINFVSLPSRPPTALTSSAPADTAYLGSIPDYGASSAGVRLAGVVQDGPAALAGLHEGDVIIALAGAKVQNIEDLTAALRRFKPGDVVEITALRTGAPVTVSATLRARR